MAGLDLFLGLDDDGNSILALLAIHKPFFNDVFHSIDIKPFSICLTIKTTTDYKASQGIKRKEGFFIEGKEKQLTRISHTYLPAEWWRLASKAKAVSRGRMWQSSWKPSCSNSDWKSLLLLLLLLSVEIRFNVPLLLLLLSWQPSKMSF